MRPLRLIPDGTTIQFMRGRFFAGLIGSAILSTVSVVLFFYPVSILGSTSAAVSLSNYADSKRSRLKPSHRSVSATSGCRSSARRKTS